VAQPVEQTLATPGDGPVGGGLWPASYRCCGWRKRNLCRGRRCRGKSAASTGVDRARSKPGGGGDGQSYGNKTRSLLAVAAALEDPGGHRSGGGRRDGFVGLVGVVRQPRPDAGRNLEAAPRPWGWEWHPSAAIKRQAVRRLGRPELGWSQMGNAWELYAEAEGWKQLVRGAGGGQWRMVGGWIKRFAPARPPPISGHRVATGTQIAQDTADLVILGAIVSKRGRGLAWPHHDAPRCARTWPGRSVYNLVIAALRAGLLLPPLSACLLRLRWPPC